MQDTLQAFEIRTYADNQWHATAHTTVARQAAALAKRLAQRGCTKRFVVSSVAEGYSLPLVYLAAWRINAAVAPIDCEDRDEELADVDIVLQPCIWHAVEATCAPADAVLPTVCRKAVRTPVDRNWIVRRVTGPSVRMPRSRDSTAS